MILKYLNLVLVFTLCLTLTGCEIYERKKKREAMIKEQLAQPVIEKVDDIDLAKLLLKPKHEKLEISRDPFKPLEITTASGKKIVPSEEISAEEVLHDLSFLGIVKTNNKYSALIKTKEGRGVFSISDKIKSLTVVAIQEEQVMFQNDNKTYTLKRGEK